MRPDAFDLDDLVAFGDIASTGGVAAAARATGIAKATLSRRLLRLEAAAGGKLFDRVGRSLKLTALGQSLSAAARAAHLARIAAESAIEAASGPPQGRIRIGSPVLFAQRILAPALGAVLRTHPAVDAEIVLDQKPQDPLRSALDLCVRIGQPETDNALIVRRIATLESGVFVAAGENVRAIMAPSDLSRLERIIVGPPGDTTWRLDRGEETARIQSSPRATVNDPASALALLLARDRGAIILPRFLVGPELNSGRLREVLTDWRAQPVNIFALMPPGRGDVPAVRAILDALIQRLKTRRAWESGAFARA